MDLKLSALDQPQRDQDGDEEADDRGIGCASHAEAFETECASNQDRVEYPVGDRVGQRNVTRFPCFTLSAKDTVEAHLEKKDREAKGIGAHIVPDQWQQRVGRLHQSE